MDRHLATSHCPTLRPTSWQYDNRFAQLSKPYCTSIQPTPLPHPQLAAFNIDAATLLDLDPAIVEDPEFVALMAGNRVLPGMEPVAAVYAGHQFGTWVPQLGDGRAILLGGVRNRAGEVWEVQLKGCGRTPYSRFADGRAVLRSTIREYLASEAMHGLGIPTTRALSIIVSSQMVRREHFEHAAVLCRLAPDYNRFGTFEYFYRNGLPEALAPLADYVIAAHYPGLAERPDRYRAWLELVTQRTAQLMVAWQTVGFVHGVMNTDNFSVLGLTLDYGPWAFFDRFDATHVFNHTDSEGRYTWARQPQVAFWNLARLMEACLPLLDDTPEAAVEIANAILDQYPPAFHEALQRRWAAKLGLQEPQDGDAELVRRWLQIMNDNHVDFTRSFRDLAGVSAAGPQPSALRAELTGTSGDGAAVDDWLDDYRARLTGQAEDDIHRRVRMNRVNPRFILRTHLAQQAIERAQADDFSEIERLRGILAHPCDEQPENSGYAEPPPETAAPTALSCSS